MESTRRYRRTTGHRVQWREPAVQMDDSGKHGSAKKRRVSEKIREHETGPAFLERSWAKRLERGLIKMDRALWRGFLGRRKVVFLVNLSVLFLLCLQMWSLMQMGGDATVMENVIESMSVEELPYPLNIVVQVHRKNVTAGKKEGRTLFAGYVRNKVGTFRDRYPSAGIEKGGTFDKVFVVSSEKCERQWEKVAERGMRMGLDVERWVTHNAKNVSLTSPPMSITKEGMRDTGWGKVGTMTLKRRVGYLATHREIWRRVVERKFQRVLILDAGTMVKEEVLRSLPGAMTNVDQESVVRQRHWHLFFLRRSKVKGSSKEKVWTTSRGMGDRMVIVRANVSVGMAGYILSMQGASLLLERVNRFRGPLDMEVGMLQQEMGDELVALSGGGEGSWDALDIVDEGERGFDCRWRRYEYPHFADIAKRMQLA